MNWMKFMIWLGLIYLSYYGAIILWDFMKKKNLPADEVPRELSFEEENEPVKEITVSKPEIYSYSVLSSGGIRLKEVFNLAREEAIEYIRPVSF
ncbi:hypothetical protein D0C36_19285 [Mucilaginibacter conchicola]|uniref:Uncharacterized protein n=1 Tax=Mucilaginibacter conchicola TaxID=2303333 RepID=A0A372NQF3_9SPHI|nr:hypothetical protein [Mucilaginibacter conchicola]RFZ91088.1 hypothetical protein D0C36_19285 [Mucilaginibacter conchicola]